MNAVTKNTPSTSDFHVADLSLADWGRKEILIAETEMPALMAIRAEYAPLQPLRGVYHFPGYEGLSIKVVPAEIKGADGNVVEVVG